MSSLVASVTQIQSCDTLHIVKFDAYGESLSMMSLELSDDIKLGSKVKLVTKPSHIAIAKDFNGEVSYSNQLKCKIESLQNGELLSAIRLSFFNSTLESIITLSSSQRMNLRVGDEVTAFIKASELSISEIIDD
jgi:molybdopterin-binding protein